MLDYETLIEFIYLRLRLSQDQYINLGLCKSQSLRKHPLEYSNLCP